MKKHIESNYLNLSLIFCLALMLIPQPYYLMLLIILGFITYIFEIFIGIFIFFEVKPMSGAKYLIMRKIKMLENEKLIEFTIKTIILIEFTIKTIILMLIIAISILYFYSAVNFMLVLTSILITFVALGLLCTVLFLETDVINSYNPEKFMDTSWNETKRMIDLVKILTKEKAIIAIAIFLTIISIILTKTNPAFLLLSISFYFVSNLKQFYNLFSGSKSIDKLKMDSTNIYIFNSALIIMLMIISLFNISPLTIMAIYTACPAIKLPDKEDKTINLDINLSILGKALIFSSLFMPPTLMPLIMISGYTIILIDTVLLNFNTDLSLQNYLTKHKRHPGSIYISISALLISLNPWLVMPTLSSQSSIFCAAATFSSQIQDIYNSMDQEQRENIFNKRKNIFNFVKSKSNR